MALTLTKERKGEIAYALVKAKIVRTENPLKNLRRELGNISASLGIDTDELREFFRETFREALEEVLTVKGKVSAEDEVD